MWHLQLGKEMLPSNGGQVAHPGEWHGCCHWRRGITVLPGGNVDRDGDSFRRGMFVLYLDTQHAGEESFSPISQLARTEAIRGACD